MQKFNLTRHMLVLV